MRSYYYDEAAVIAAAEKNASPDKVV
jgi:hypothetical protein